MHSIRVSGYGDLINPIEREMSLRFKIAELSDQQAQMILNYETPKLD